MAKPVLPNELKKLRGTDQPIRMREEIDLPLVEEIPLPPVWLNDQYGIAEWERLAPKLFAVGLLTEVSISTLAMLCALFGSIVSGITKGEMASANTINCYRALCGEFGMTPATASKVKIADKKPVNEFSNNGQRSTH